MTDQPEVAAFLLARIEETEHDAHLMAKAFPGTWEMSDRGWMAKLTADGPGFLRVVQIEQDQAVAAGIDAGTVWLSDVIRHVDRHHPARVLADCAARRAIVAAFQDAARWYAEAEGDPSRTLTDTVRHFEHMEALRLAVQHLAQPYDDHPDFNSAWRL